MAHTSQTHTTQKYMNKYIYIFVSFRSSWMRMRFDAPLSWGTNVQSFSSTHTHTLKSQNIYREIVHLYVFLVFLIRTSRPALLHQVHTPQWANWFLNISIEWQWMKRARESKRCATHTLAQNTYLSIEKALDEVCVARTIIWANNRFT